MSGIQTQYLKFEGALLPQYPKLLALVPLATKQLMSIYQIGT